VQSVSSSLGANLSSSTAGIGSSSGPSEQVNIIQTDVCFVEEDMDVPEIVEEVIDLLLTGLRDSVCSHPDIILYNFDLIVCNVLVTFTYYMMSSLSCLVGSLCVHEYD
jgi:hypothetical protein